MLGVVYLGEWGLMPNGERLGQKEDGRGRRAGRVATAGIWLVAGCWVLLPRLGVAETCTTQSAMQPGDREALAQAARELTGRLQAGDAAGLEAQSVPELRKDFSGIRAAAADLAPHLKGDTLAVDQVYLLDATTLAVGSDAQFFCTLNKTQAEVDLSIAGLTAGTYGFAVVYGTGASPWRVSLLLRRDVGRWLLAGFFPGPREAAGHDGVWYWREARRLTAAKQPWTAWLYYTEAQSLLRPAGFVQTTHLERLQDEQKAGAPPALSSGVSAGTPLVIKGPDGKEYRITGLGVEALVGRNKADVVLHVDEPSTDPTTLRERGDGAARALLAVCPELRTSFDGVLVSLEGAGRPALVTEHLMAGVK